MGKVKVVEIDTVFVELVVRQVLLTDVVVLHRRAKLDSGLAPQDHQRVAFTDSGSTKRTLQRKHRQKAFEDLRKPAVKENKEKVRKRTRRVACQPGHRTK